MIVLKVRDNIFCMFSFGVFLGVGGGGKTTSENTKYLEVLIAYSFAGIIWICSELQ